MRGLLSCIDYYAGVTCDPGTRPPRHTTFRTFVTFGTAKVGEVLGTIDLSAPRGCNQREGGFWWMRNGVLPVSRSSNDCIVLKALFSRASNSDAPFWRLAGQRRRISGRPIQIYSPDRICWGKARGLGWQRYGPAGALLPRSWGPTLVWMWVIMAE